MQLRCGLTSCLGLFVLTACPSIETVNVTSFMTTMATTTGDGDGDTAETGTSQGDGDGDGDPTPGDGDGDGDPGDGDGDGDGDSGDGDGDGDGDPCGNAVVDPGEQCDVGVETMFCDGDCTYAMCGDGYHNMLSEQCDDGNAVNDDGCVGACLLNVCGDGVMWLDMEECDDGNMIDTDECKSDCTNAVCGDGVIQDEVEQCEDLNMVDDDACTNACQAAVCGDGILWAGMEVCDDGNFDDDDMCPGSCAPAFCGDGYTLEGAEECDDGNDVDDDGCTNDCVSLYPPACTQGVDPGTNAPWVVCSSSPQMAWLSANSQGQYHPVLICQNMGYDTVGQYGGTCGNVCGFCEGQTSCMNPGQMNFNFGNWNGMGNCGEDMLGPIICQTIHWTCVNN